MARSRHPVVAAMLGFNKPKPIVEPVGLQDRHQQLIKAMGETQAAFKKKHDELKKKALRQDAERWDEVLSWLRRVETSLGKLDAAVKELKSFAEKLPDKTDPEALMEALREVLPPPQEASTLPEMTLEITERDSDGDIQQVVVKPKDAPLH